MRNEVFNVTYQKITPKGDVNLIGVITHYFDDIYGKNKDETCDTYIRDYNERIFPIINVAIPASDYTDEMLHALIQKLQHRYGYDDATVRGRYRHLITQPIITYHKDHGDINSLWGSSMGFTYQDDIDAALLIIKKSFTSKERGKIKELLLDSNPCIMSGQRFALLVQYLTGMRNSEVCGLNFGDVIDNPLYKDCHSIRIYKTTLSKGNALKAGGKTKNMPRVEPMHFLLYEKIMERRNYIVSNVEFPIKDKNGNVYKDVDSLPIACDNNSFADRCNGSMLSEVGKSFLRDELKINANRYSGVSELLLRNTEIIEKDPTVYLLRRNFVTMAKLVNLSDTEIRYIIGHDLEDSEFDRNDFLDSDFQYAIWKRINKMCLS